MRSARSLAIFAALIGRAFSLPAQTPPASDRPTLYTVGYAHLDTQWLWDYTHTIDEYLPATMRDNFALIERYPGYGFNFSGANRYRMMKEYYPADYAKVQRYVAQGRWFPAGSSVEEGDVNLPSAEAILRQILYGNDYFRREFGTASVEYLLPDSFGFPWSLPTILAHAGLVGFSTAKLTWGSSVPDQPTTPYGMKGKGVPFNVGRWIGPNGRGVVAALNPGDYIKHIGFDLSQPGAPDSSSTPAAPRTWSQRLLENRRILGLAADYIYVGTGDIGGAPNEGTVAWLEKAVSNSTGAIRVVSKAADQFFRDLTPATVAKLPRYAGEMELTNHSAGSLTSQAYHKRLMRRNEVLADAAEKASTGAAVLGVRRYPRGRLRDAWTLMLAGHFHDIAAGTATPKAHSLSWNDGLIATNQLAAVTTDASEAIAGELDTRAVGVPLVVYNPLDLNREDVVEATIAFPGGVPEAVTVVGPDGRPVPAQLENVSGSRATVVFSASVPSVGYAVYDVRPGAVPGPTPTPTPLAVTARSVENARYRVRIDARGDIARIYDKRLRRQLLRAPIRLAVRSDTPADFPAWNMDWADQIKPPRAYVGVGKPPVVTVTERGPARVALTVERSLDSSRISQTIRLAAGDGGNRVEIKSVIEWRESNAALKVMFPLEAANDSATYNLQVGTIRRGTRTPRKFEVSSHQWIDLTDRTGTHGVTILTGDQHGSDKPNGNTIGLTLLRTPGLSPSGRFYPHQATQDWGRHEVVYGLASHARDWRGEGTDWQAYRLDTPMMVFGTTSHAGPLGRSTSLLRSSSSRVRVMAFKQAERSEAFVVRLVELDGRPAQNVRLSFPAPIRSVREVNGQEEPIERPVTVTGGGLVASLASFEIRSFAVTFDPPAAGTPGPERKVVPLQYDRAVASADGAPSDEGFDAAGQALPVEMMGREVAFAGIQFELAPSTPGGKNAMVAHGQTVRLPPGDFDRVYLLAASAEGDQPARFMVGDRPVDLTIQDWGGYIGQWDTRRWKRIELPAKEAAGWTSLGAQAKAQFAAEVAEAASVGGDTSMARAGVERSSRLLSRHLAALELAYDGITPGFVKPAPIAWFASHRHDAHGRNEAYAYSYLFAYVIDLPPGASTLVLPDNDRVRVMAVTVARAGATVTPAWPLYDSMARDERAQLH